MLTSGGLSKEPWPRSPVVGLLGTGVVCYNIQESGGFRENSSPLECDINQQTNLSPRLKHPRNSFAFLFHFAFQLFFSVALCVCPSFTTEYYPLTVIMRTIIPRSTMPTPSKTSSFDGDGRERGISMAQAFGSSSSGQDDENVIQMNPLSSCRRRILAKRPPPQSVRRRRTSKAVPGSCHP